MRFNPGLGFGGVEQLNNEAFRLKFPTEVRVYFWLCLLHKYCENVYPMDKHKTWNSKRDKCYSQKDINKRQREQARYDKQAIEEAIEDEILLHKGLSRFR